MTSLKQKIAVLPVIASLCLGFTLAASAQVVGPRLAINLLTTGLTQNAAPGTTGAIVAAVRLDTTGSTEAVRLSSLPLSLITGNGATGNSLRACHFANVASPTVSLNNAGNVPNSLVGGLNTFTLDNTLVIPAGSVMTLDLMCNVDPGAVTGGTYTFSLNTANVSAIGNTTGLPATVTVGGAAPIITPIIVPVVPGLPNTGAGGEATKNVAFILSTLAVSALALAWSRRFAR